MEFRNGASPAKVAPPCKPGHEPMRVAEMVRPKHIGAAFLVAVAYYLGARLAFYIGTLSYLFAPLWPPNVILLCALLLAPYPAWALYIMAALPAHIVAETQ